MVAITGAPGNDALVRRAARQCRRTGAELVAVHVRTADDLPPHPQLDELRAEVATLGGRYHEIVADDVAPALLRFAEQEHATEIILGATRRRGWDRLLRGSIERRVVGAADDLGVRVVGGTGRDADPTGPTVPAAAHVRRSTGSVPAWLLAPVALGLLTVVLTSMGSSVDLAAALLCYLLVVVGLAVLGGRVVALASAVASFLLANWWLTPPVHTWKISHTENVVALVAFVAVTGVVSTYVSVARTRTLEAQRARAEAESLARLSATFADADPLAAVVSHLRSTFGFDAVSVLRRAGDGWTVEAAAGRVPPERPEGAAFVHEIADDVVLVCTGRRISDDDQRVLRVFTVHLAAAVERGSLSRAAARADALDRTNALRTALLQSLSHDLRTPLAAIKANVSSLRDPDIDWPVPERAEFLESIEDEADHLTRLVTNLVDLGRIQTGELRPRVRAVSLEEVVPAAVHDVGPAPVHVDIDLPDDLPDVAVDPALLERSIANLVANAVRFSPAPRPVVVRAHVDDGRVVIEVVDHGPGIAPEQRAAVVRPFQRLDDVRHQSGVGLGLAIADAFARSMHGTLTLDDTPGGGCTARLGVPIAPSSNGGPS